MNTPYGAAQPDASAVATALAAHIRGKTVAVTGVSPGGLGAVFSEAIAAASPKLIILAARDPAKAEATATTIKAINPAVATRPLTLDLASLPSVRAAAAEVNAYTEPHIDVLVNNAGVMAVPWALSPDGFEMQLAANHLGHFLFTNLIMSKLLAAPAGPRVVNITSDGYTLSPVRYLDWNFHGGEVYDKWAGYGQSKTANILFARGLAARFGPRGLRAYSVHPGVAVTNLGNHLDVPAVMQEYGTHRQRAGLKGAWDTQGFSPLTPAQCAAGHVHAAFAPEVEEHNGEFFEGVVLADVDEMQPWAVGEREARKCWQLSERLVGQEFAA